MTMPIKLNGKQLSPCIIAKAKIGLELKTGLPNNKKTCSYQYWKKTVKHIAQLSEIVDPKIIDRAIQRTDLYKISK